MEERLITLSIHTYEKAQILKTLLESEGIDVFIHNVNLIQPVISAGVRVRIKESDLPHALRVIETTQFFNEDKDLQQEELTKKVLIPVDFSEYSMRACEIGFEYASRTGSEVMLLHAYYSTSFTPSSLLHSGMMHHDAIDNDSMQLLYDRVQADIKKMISSINNKISSGELPEVKYNYVIRGGLPEDEIIAYANEYRPALIIMGTRGKNRKNLDLIGSVTAEIIEVSEIPLLAIPEEISFENLEKAANVAFAISFSQQDIVAFDHFIKLMANYSPKIHLFNVSTSKDELDEIRLTGVCEYLKKHYKDIEIDFTVFCEGSLLDSIDNFVQEKNIDIITLTTHRRSMIMRIFNTSMASKMLFHTNTALFVIPKI